VKYAVERARDVDRDLAAIFEFLIESYLSFGEDVETAFDRAADRLRQIHDSMEALGDLPHQGTVLPQLLPGLRSVTMERAIFYFRVDDTKRKVQVLAVFFGGQDHRRHMLKRLLGG
jgi:plasmid stabilization system protein ParE